MSGYESQVVMVTGAQGGLGQAVTRAYLDAGATVVGIARRIAQDDFPSERFTALPADLSSEAGVQEAAAAVLARHGRADVLAHLMGGYEGGTRIEETRPAVFEKMFALNFWPAVYLARAFLPAMRAAGAGRILAIGARPAVEPVATLGAYGAAKAALVSLVRTLAAENKDRGITANLILPGVIDTPANRAAMPGADFRRWVPPSRIASLALWLTSADAADVTGALIPMYGAGA
jgi:NAD(P)-dependent dehydrogenase (short-subunit alcohol dehydrogenase family)